MDFAVLGLLGQSMSGFCSPGTPWTILGWILQSWNASDSPWVDFSVLDFIGQSLRGFCSPCSFQMLWPCFRSHAVTHGLIAGTDKSVPSSQCPARDECL